MVFVQRNAEGEVTAVANEAQPGFDEELPPTHPDVVGYFDRLGTTLEIGTTDKDFVRVLEDVVDLLMSKNIIRFTDLPDEAQGKILRRQALREAARDSLDLLGDDKLF